MYPRLDEKHAPLNNLAEKENDWQGERPQAQEVIESLAAEYKNYFEIIDKLVELNEPYASGAKKIRLKSNGKLQSLFYAVKVVGDKNFLETTKGEPFVQGSMLVWPGDDLLQSDKTGNGPMGYGCGIASDKNSKSGPIIVYNEDTPFIVGFQSSIKSALLKLLRNIDVRAWAEAGATDAENKGLLLAEDKIQSLIKISKSPLAKMPSALLWLAGES